MGCGKRLLPLSSRYDIKGVSMGTPSFSVYIIECADQTLYTGFTRNVEKRINEHNSGKTGAKYTRGRRPVTLVYVE